MLGQQIIRYKSKQYSIGFAHVYVVQRYEKNQPSPMQNKNKFQAKLKEAI
jgi:hypothetical protein